MSEIIGKGRAGQILSVGDGRVLKTAPGSNLAAEAEAMMYARAKGFPAPKVFAYDEDSITMQRVAGITVSDDLKRHPWRLRTHGRALATLQQRLHRISPSPTMRRVSEGDSLLHLDFHPDNVMVTPSGLVVIDWANAAAGDGALDAALSWLIFATSPIQAAPVVRHWLARGRASFIAGFMSMNDRQRLLAKMDRAAEFRIADRNLDEEQAERVRSFLKSLGIGNSEGW